MSYSNLIMDKDKSYAIFGGYNPDQFIGELIKFPLVNERYWSLGIKMVAYGNDVVETFSKGSAYAIMDTGTTMLGIPDTYFSVIRKKWLK